MAIAGKIQAARAEVRFAADTSAVKAGIRQVERDLKGLQSRSSRIANLGAQVRGLGEGVTRFGRRMSMAGVAAAAPFALAAKAVGDFDREFSAMTVNFGKKLGSTAGKQIADEMRSATSEAKKAQMQLNQVKRVLSGFRGQTLNIAGELPVTPQQVARMASTLAKGGLSPDTVFKKTRVGKGKNATDVSVLKAFAQAASTDLSGAGPEEITANLLSTLKALGKLDDAAGKGIDPRSILRDVASITKATTQANVSFLELTETLKFPGGILAGNIKLDPKQFQELLAVSSLLKESLAGASIAGTSLRGFTLKLRGAQEGDAVSKQLKKFGLEIADFRSDDGQGFASISEVIRLLNSRKELFESPAEFQGAVAGLFDARQVSAAIKLLDVGADAIERRTKDLTFDDQSAVRFLQNFTDEMNNNLRGSIIRTQSALGNLGVVLGDTFKLEAMGALEGLIKGIKQLTGAGDGATGFLKENAQAVKRIIIGVGAIVGLGAAISAVGIALSTVSLPIIALGLILPQIGKSTGLLTKGWMGLTGAIKGIVNPIRTAAREFKQMNAAATQGVFAKADMGRAARATQLPVLGRNVGFDNAMDPRQRAATSAFSDLQRRRKAANAALAAANLDSNAVFKKNKVAETEARKQLARARKAVKDKSRIMSPVPTAPSGTRSRSKAEQAQLKRAKRAVKAFRKSEESMLSMVLRDLGVDKSGKKGSKSAKKAASRVSRSAGVSAATIDEIMFPKKAGRSRGLLGAVERSKSLAAQEKAERAAARAAKKRAATAAAAAAAAPPVVSPVDSAKANLSKAISDSRKANNALKRSIMAPVKQAQAALDQANAQHKQANSQLRRNLRSAAVSPALIGGPPKDAATAKQVRLREQDLREASRQAKKSIASGAAVDQALARRVKVEQANVREAKRQVKRLTDSSRVDRDLARAKRKVLKAMNADLFSLNRGMGPVLTGPFRVGAGPAAFPSRPQPIPQHRSLSRIAPSFADRMRGQASGVPPLRVIPMQQAMRNLIESSNRIESDRMQRDVAQARAFRESETVKRRLESAARARGATMAPGFFGPSGDRVRDVKQRSFRERMNLRRKALGRKLFERRTGFGGFGSMAGRLKPVPRAVAGFGGKALASSLKNLTTLAFGFTAGLVALTAKFAFAVTAVTSLVVASGMLGKLFTAFTEGTKTIQSNFLPAIDLVIASLGALKGKGSAFSVSDFLGDLQTAAKILLLSLARDLPGLVINVVKAIFFGIIDAIKGMSSVAGSLLGNIFGDSSGLDQEIAALTSTLDSRMKELADITAKNKGLEDARLAEITGIEGDPVKAKKVFDEMVSGLKAAGSGLKDIESREDFLRAKSAQKLLELREESERLTESFKTAREVFLEKSGDLAMMLGGGLLKPSVAGRAFADLSNDLVANDPALRKQKELADAQAEYTASLIDQAKELRSSMLPQVQLNETVSKYKEMLKRGLISQNLYNEAVAIATRNANQAETDRLNLLDEINNTKASGFSSSVGQGAFFSKFSANFSSSQGTEQDKFRANLEAEEKVTIKWGQIGDAIGASAKSLFNVFSKTNPLGVLFIALEDKLPKSIDEVADSLSSLAGYIKKTSDATPPGFKKGEFSDAIIPDFDNDKTTGPISSIRPPEKLPSMLPTVVVREPDDYGTAIRKMEASGGNSFRANGGPVKAGGSYIVGEKGPELFFPTESGHILSNGLSKKVDGMFADGTIGDKEFLGGLRGMMSARPPMSGRSGGASAFGKSIQASELTENPALHLIDSVGQEIAQQIDRLGVPELFSRSGSAFTDRFGANPFAEAGNRVFGLGSGASESTEAFRAMTDEIRNVQFSTKSRAFSPSEFDPTGELEEKFSELSDDAVRQIASSNMQTINGVRMPGLRTGLGLDAFKEMGRRDAQSMSDKMQAQKSKAFATMDYKKSQSDLLKSFGATVVRDKEGRLTNDFDLSKVADEDFKKILAGQTGINPSNMSVQGEATRRDREAFWGKADASKPERTEPVLQDFGIPAQGSGAGAGLEMIQPDIGMNTVDTSGMMAKLSLPKPQKPDFKKMQRARERATMLDRMKRMEEAKEERARKEEEKNQRIHELGKEGRFEEQGFMGQNTAANRKKHRLAQIRARLAGHSPQAAMNAAVPDAPAIPAVDQGAAAKKAGQNAVNSAGAIKQLEMINTALGDQTQLLSKIEGNTKNNRGVIVS